MAWHVAQIGAREHYAVARAVRACGEQVTLYTDAWARAGRSLLRRCPRPLRTLATRYHPDLANGAVVSDTIRTCYHEARRRDVQQADRRLRYIEEGRRFGGFVAERLARRAARGDVFFGYTTGSLEALHVARDLGMFSIVDQIDAARTWDQVVRQERERWPDWERAPEVVPEVYWERLETEWRAADVVMVNSKWSERALIAQGVAPEKIRVVPLAFEAGPVAAQPIRRGDGPLVVLWLGTVTLGKGIQYLVEAAKLLRDRNVVFDVYGPLAISEERLRSAPANVRFHGRIARDQAHSAYAKSHLFAFPTLSDGFGMTQLEAMAHGLPVIATPNCGDVVTHGQDGCIVPPRDPEAIAQAIVKYEEDGDLLEGTSAAALGKVKDFSLERLGLGLLTIVRAAMPLCSHTGNHPCLSSHG